MDLKDYFREINAQETAIETPFVMVISLKTPNGGREGVTSEVSRGTAAQLLVEKQARLATSEEIRKLREERAKSQRAKELASLQERLRTTRLAEDELRVLRRALKRARAGE